MVSVDMFWIGRGQRANTAAAENYYTADYPDEELDSGDEYDRDAYNYRGNASDQEEFDEDDYVMEFGDNDNLNDAPTLPNARMGLQPPSAFK